MLKNRKMRKLIALAMSVVMLFLMASPVSAATAATSSDYDRNTDHGYDLSTGVKVTGGLQASGHHNCLVNFYATLRTDPLTETTTPVYDYFRGEIDVELFGEYVATYHTENHFDIEEYMSLSNPEYYDPDEKPVDWIMATYSCYAVEEYMGEPVYTFALLETDVSYS